MKKLLAVVVLLLSCGSVQALDVTDQIKLSLLDHVVAANQIADGGNRVVLVDTIVLIGKHNGRSILDLQGGIAGDSRPEADEVGINWLGGAFFKISSLIRDQVHFADQYKFLNALEYGLFVNRDFTQKEWVSGIQVGLAFSLNPIE